MVSESVNVCFWRDFDVGRRTSHIAHEFQFNGSIMQEGRQMVQCEQCPFSFYKHLICPHLSTGF